MKKPRFSIVLYEPDIPWNTGAIGRTCVALELELILIHPIGFSLDDRQVRRAGMDYWPHVQLVEYPDFEAFLEDRKPALDHLFFLESNMNNCYYHAEFKEGSYIILGSEVRGIAQKWLDKYADRVFELPMYSPHIRSLNLANTTTAVAYEALRQIEFAS